MIELEKTYLAKKIPSDLKRYKFKEIIDIYIPPKKTHPKLRLRKCDNLFEITKKEPVTGTDSSCQNEETIIINEEEFNYLNKQIKGKRIHKYRYYYKYKNNIAEFDIFQENLSGLVVIDFEFKTSEEKNKFEMPNFCLADVTQKAFIAGGKICGQSYKDIKNDLDKFKYKKLFLN